MLSQEYEAHTNYYLFIAYATYMYSV